MTGSCPWPPLWGHQAQWDVRQHPRVHRAFAALYGRDDLIVSQDGAGIKPPTAVRDDRAAQALPIHWDRDPRGAQLAVQGVLYLTDAGAEHGAFCGVPGLFADLDGWLARHPDAGTEDVDLEGHELVPVPGRAGDLVLFSAKLPHGNGANTAATTRIVQYVSMWPLGAPDASAEESAALYRSGRASPAFRRRPGWDVVQPWPPATLTPLGRRLAGLDAWTTATASV